MRRKDTVGFEIKTLDNLLFRRLLAFAARRGIDELTVMHGWILGFLYDNPDRDIFQKNIETEFSIARSTVTGILKLMEKKGYIRRESVPQDGRLKRLILTEKGRKIHEENMMDIDSMEQHIRSGISQKDMDTFFCVIRKIRKNLEKEVMKEAEYNA